MTRAFHAIDYARFDDPHQAFSEWLAWVTAVAPLDVGLYF